MVMLTRGSLVAVFPFIVQSKQPPRAGGSSKTVQFISVVSPSLMSDGVIVRFTVTSEC